MSVDAARRRFTVNEYLHMAHAGILTDTDRVELLDGEIVEMAPAGRTHTACVAVLVRVLLTGAGPRAVVWPQGPIRLSERSQPESDVSLLRPRSMPYRDADVEPRDVLLLVEVSDTSLRRDRELKLPLYAAAGIPEYWIADVRDAVVEVHMNPSGSSYGSVQRFGSGDFLSPLAFPELRIAIDDIFS